MPYDGLSFKKNLYGNLNMSAETLTPQRSFSMKKKIVCMAADNGTVILAQSAYRFSGTHGAGC